MTLSLAELAQCIDHTNLKAAISLSELKQLCEEATTYGFKMVAINSGQTAPAAKLLADSNVAVGAAIGFPLGQTTLAVKLFEASEAIKAGANEIDYVINLTAVKEQDFAYIEKEMQEIVALCRTHQVTSKVIFENCYLTKAEIKQLATIARMVKPDFIKTSTGFGTGGATVEDVKLMAETVGTKVKVKAAGGIRDLTTMLAMLNAGASRIGTSASVKIMQEAKAMGYR